MNIHNLHKIFTEECNQLVCTDTRKMVPGGIFFALKGGQHDGNTHAQEAIELGCRYAVVDDQSLVSHDHMICVPDVQATLTELAKYHRNQFNIPVVGLTGSNGKTTTKELIFAAMIGQKKVIATEGNLNNHIGVPLTLLRIQEETDIVIVEMGANHIGEIKQLCHLAEPTHGIITNIGRAHLGYFGGFGGVIQAKTEMYHYLRDHGGEVFVNGGDELLIKYSDGISRTLYGPATDGIFKVESKHTVPNVSVHSRLVGDIKTHLTGEYNVDNIACAITVASHFNVLPVTIKKGLEEYMPTNNRSEMLETDSGNLVIKDFYNANRSSMVAALDGTAAVRGERGLVIILGDMFELGEYSSEEHQYIADYASAMNPELLVLVGSDFHNVHTDSAKMFITTKEAIAFLAEQEFHNKVILIKGSNGMRFIDLFDSKSW